MTCTQFIPVVARRWWWVLCGGLLVAGHHARAQRARGASPVAAVVDTTRKALSARQTEEALRLLLRADSLQQARVPPGLEADAEGFVLDQTLTKPGRDFYEAFYATLQSQSGLGDYTIALVEKPFRGNSSLIFMIINDSELLEIPLPTRPEQLEEAVAMSADLARSFLAEQRATVSQMEAGPPPAAKP